MALTTISGLDSDLLKRPARSCFLRRRCGGLLGVREVKVVGVNPTLPNPPLLWLLMCFGSAFMRAPCGRSQRWEQPHCWNVLLAHGEHAGCHALSSQPGLSSQFAVTQKQRHLTGSVRIDAGRAVISFCFSFCVILHRKVSPLCILRRFYLLLSVNMFVVICY